MISYAPTFKVFVWTGASSDSLPVAAGFEWSDTAKRWFTRSPYIAWLARRGGVADEAAKQMTLLDSAVASSQAIEPFLPGAPGLYPFQAAGVEHAVEQYRRGRQALLLSDDPGLGKSAQSLTIAKTLGFKRLLVICPASLRLNWLREIALWHGGPAQAILDGKALIFKKKCSIVTSYNLAHHFKDMSFDFLIVDECFPRFTQVVTENGEKDISDVVFGTDRFVRTIDTGRVVFRRITGRVCKKPSCDLVKITHARGVLICTENHPVWVETKGWVDAGRLRCGDRLRVVQEELCGAFVGAEGEREKTEILLPVMLSHLEDDCARDKGESPLPASVGQNVPVEQNAFQRASGACGAHVGSYESREPDGSPRGAGEDESYFTSYRPQAKRARGERPADADSADGSHRQAEGSSGVHCINKGLPHVFSGRARSQSLQNRRRAARCESGGRSRWDVSPIEGAARTGHEERAGFEFSRVDSVSIYEQRDSYDGLVFCLEVEGANSFLADGVLVHNCHAIKNADTQRTKLILGSGKEWRGLVDKTPSIFLTGTPVPNGRPSEMWPVIFRCAPEIIDYMKYWTFVDRFCLVQDDGQGGVLIRGAKRQAELYARLRGSGFMIRRLKEDVLKDLPPKQYKMVVFPADSETRKVLHKESAFSADEILRHGVPVGSALPEYRREMGIAKVPQAVEYIRDMLEGGVEKVVVFAHHVEVIGLLRQALEEYGVEVITGATSAAARQAAVDQFQKDPARRVFIGNIIAAGVGTTLTAAQDVVLVEASWVPGENDQAIDRLHRIGQIGSVLAHILVVEGSLDAKILGSAAHKAGDVGKILDGR
ncbi:MAG: SNF2-related protein [Acidithiobacillus sp.]|nr:SNF2-related protein [Acidithiobacillus sp.]